MGCAEASNASATLPTFPPTFLLAAEQVFSSPASSNDCENTHIPLASAPCWQCGIAQSNSTCSAAGISAQNSPSEQQQHFKSFGLGPEERTFISAPLPIEDKSQVLPPLPHSARQIKSHHSMSKRSALLGLIDLVRKRKT